MTLLTTVLTLIQQLDCSVLPLQDKKPLGKWKHLTQRKPTPQELESWFNNATITSYGIILGDISNHLIALDFDSETNYQHFQGHFPRLSQSFTVRSRRGYHVYLRTDHTVRTQRFAHGELLGEHSYLVGPGSQIHTGEEDFTYTIQNNSEVLQVNQKQLQAVITCLTRTSRAVTPLTIANHQQQTLAQLTQHYQQAAANGRNHALYATAIGASRAGWSLDQISPALTQLHIATPPPGPHPAETPQQRQQEATRTLHSAYKHARNTSKVIQQGTIPTNVHEALLQRFGGSTIPGRLLEALYRSIYNPGDTITQAQARTIGARFHIGDHSVRACFSGRFSTLNPQGDRLFNPTTQPPCRDYDKTTTNSVGSPPAAYYRIPSIDELCRALGVEAQSSDRLRDADLCSAKAFRMALHRALIDRVQPEQSCRWHADRLAVSPRTIHRYNAALGVHSVPIYAYTPLSWGNIDQPAHYGMPAGPRGITPGQWLQRQDGRRFPALKGIALRQLAQGRVLVAIQRRPSRWQLLPPPQPVLWRRADYPQPDYFGTANRLPPITPPPKPMPPPAKDPDPPPKARERVGHDLTTIKGIGPRRAQRLQRFGIHSLDDLIAAGAEQLARFGWPGGYVTLYTTHYWIEQAEIQLGRRQPDPLEVEWQQWVAFRKGYRRFLRDLIRWEDDLFGTGHLWQANPHIQAILAQQGRVIWEEAAIFLRDYQARVEGFLALPADLRQRYALGTTRTWRRWQRRLAQLQTTGQGDADTFATAASIDTD